MRSFLNVIGILLILFGIFTLAYNGFTYTSQEKIAEIGTVKITADSEKTVYFPPVLGGLSFLAGVILVIVARNGKQH